MNVWTLLERARRAHPDAIAVGAGRGGSAYSVVHRNAIGLAAFCRARGVRAGDRVAILAWNGAEYLETYFAAAALGAVLVPLNVRLSAREHADVLCDSGARTLVADASLAEQVGELFRSGASLDTIVWIGNAPRRSDSGGSRAVHASFGNAIACDASAFTLANPGPDAVAHLYYTSGTTGDPKGVMLTHANVCEHAAGAIEELALTSRDVWAHIAPMFHLADAWATFAITAVGGRHVFLRRFDAQHALDLIENESVTITNLVPTMLNAMVHHPSARFEVDHGARARSADDDARNRSGGDPSGRTVAREGERARERPRNWSSLRMILSGGAPIAREVVRAVIDTFGCEYAQTYGMTETSPYLTLSLLRPHLAELPFEEQLAYKCKTGRAFAGVELRVVDENGRDVAADERAVGEIWVRGPTVTPGYWNRPAETAAAFEKGWLKTGDLAVIDGEGYVTIVDRKKDMIITGGEKVYSIEVEKVLHAHPSVLECAVFGVPDDVWGESVCAAIVVRDGASITADELRDHCRASIASYKVPRAIRFLAALPRTGSGKIHKRALRESFSSPVR